MTQAQFRELKSLMRDGNRRVDRIEKKVDGLAENCVGCAREFGQVAEQAKEANRRLDEHTREHRWRMGIAATIGGILVTAAHAVISWIRGH